jgi:transposase-like protein
MGENSTSDDSGFQGRLPIKLIYLALRQIEAKWQRPPKAWRAAKSQLAIQFGARFTLEN